MAIDIPNYESDFREAIVQFWALRDGQAEAQRQKNQILDAGTRSAVTGGKHLGPLEAVVAKVFLDAGMPADAILTGSNTVLPGYHRASKSWDLVVLYKSQVVAILELKSQVGSFGNNQNNRIEEAIGQAVDIWDAAGEGYLSEIRPWFGYLMVVEDSPKSTVPVKVTSGLLPHDPAFDGMSYVDRYVEAFGRMQATKKLDAACVAQSKKDGATCEFPRAELSFQYFATLIHNRCREVLTLLGPPTRKGLF